MGTVNFSVPDDVKEAFNAAFQGENKSAIVTELMREAIDRAARRERSRRAIERILEAHAKAPIRSAKELRAARQKGRP